MCVISVKTQTIISLSFSVKVNGERSTVYSCSRKYSIASEPVSVILRYLNERFVTVTVDNRLRNTYVSCILTLQIPNSTKSMGWTIFIELGIWNNDRQIPIFMTALGVILLPKKMSRVIVLLNIFCFFWYFNICTHFLQLDPLSINERILLSVFAVRYSTS